MVIVWLNVELWTHGPKGGWPGVSACPASQPASQPAHPSGSEAQKNHCSKNKPQDVGKKKKKNYFIHKINKENVNVWSEGERDTFKYTFIQTGLRSNSNIDRLFPQPPLPSFPPSLPLFPSSL